VIRVGTLKLTAIEWRGEGTPLVLLHGLGGNAASWAGLAHQLTGRHIIALDLPGHGESPVATTWDYMPLALGIVAAVRSEWPGKHIWVGHSWGGRFAVVAAAADSTGTQGLILVDAVQVSSFRIADVDGTVEGLFKGELDPWPSLDSALFAVRTLPQFSPWTPDAEVAFRRAVVVQPDGRVTPLLSRDKAATVLRTFATDNSEAISRIFAPVLVLSAPDSFSERAQRRLFPLAQFVSVRGNHWLHINNVEGTSREILNWLRQNGL
jgi:pimeloyl-ACP methyl ester carboxylesterase